MKIVFIVKEAKNIILMTAKINQDQMIVISAIHPETNIK
jgi:hypothetical protein